MGIVLLAGTSHQTLAEMIAFRLGIACAKLICTSFANGELQVEIGESIRDHHVYILQTSSGCINDQLMELLILIHACKISSAAKITAILPFFPYSKQVTNVMSRPYIEPVSPWQERMLAKFNEQPDTVDGYTHWTARSGSLISQMIETSGADHIITMDLHRAQCEGFFGIPVDNLPCNPLIIRHLQVNFPTYREAIVVSPDAGGAKRATELANILGLDFALIHNNQSVQKGSQPPTFGSSSTLVGSVEGRDVILYDDMADTCVTLIEAAKLLKSSGAKNIFAVILHGIFSGNSIQYLQQSQITHVIVSNTLPQDVHQQACDKIQVFDVSPILSEAIRRCHNGESISYLFKPQAFC